MNSPDKKSIECNISGFKMDYPYNTIYNLFAERAKMHPNSIAIEFESTNLTYDELSVKANQMAHYFWSQGLRPGQIVAVSLNKTPELMICLFALLQCGAAYLPLDAKFPKTRLEFMLEDSEAGFLLTSKAIASSLPNHSKTIFIDDLYNVIAPFSAQPISVPVTIDAAVYMIYTSGSTGKPKGVVITHKNFVNLLYSIAIEPGIQADDKFLSITTISFDIACVELFLPLFNGATVVFADYETTRDGQLILDLVQNKGITILQATPTTWQMLLNSGWENPVPIKAFCGGEALSLNLARELITRCNSLWNMYGPTETTIYSIIKQVRADDQIITIGFPIANTQIHLLDETGQVVPVGEIGEIVIGGDGVGKGYLGRAELTAEKFIPNPFSTNSTAVMYRTGDLGKLVSNGEIQCLGRIDHQVKIRGHRIELGEIEAVLNTIQGIQQCAVIVSDYLGNEPKIIAYLKSVGLAHDEKQISATLSKILPEILIPSRFIWVNDFPTTPSGKIDKKNLPTPEYVRPDSAPILRKPRTTIEKEIAKVWLEELKLPVVGIDDNFFEMGGTSFLAQRVVTALRKNSNEQVAVSTLYRHPTIAQLADHFAAQKKSHAVKDYSKVNNTKSSRDVAIIGMAGRFPGATTIQELWDVLKEGRETISFFNPDELDASIPESVRNNPLYVGARGIIPTANTFDAVFFGINPKIAEVMDPQQRLFLEISWEILEQTGYLPKHFAGRIGVYAGVGTNTYYKKNILPNDEILDNVGYLNAETVNEKDYISTRTSYHLNLKGPAVSVHSACSTSLLAIAEAVQAIRNDQCEIALAGASSITAPINSGHLYEEGSMLSADGHCRAFDAAGKGTVFSDGAGVILLKSLETAVQDGDTIYGIIKGVGVSNDGGNKGSFTAPSAEGQAAAISEALFDAKVSPDSISYVEAHGTATPIGDPIEIEGLKIGYGKLSKNGYCAIGSIKTNMGHLTAAAGVAGLIKTILAMNNKLIPASLGFEKPNPSIDFENSPFFVNAKLRNWQADGALRAGISSFGVGGTNVHLIVEEFPSEQKVSSSSRPVQLLMWSAKSENSLKGYATELGKFVQSKTDLQLADVAYSLNKTRDTFAQRSFLVSETNIDASQELLSNEKHLVKSSVLKIAPSELVFLFPGQGAQFSQMGINLYKNELVFREAIDTCAAFLLDDLQLDIRDILYPEIVTPDTEAVLKNTRFTQPALFVTEYALSQLWISWGIKPTAYCGHSIGEYVAAHLAGIIGLQDALHLIAVRGRLISELPTGGMLSVKLAEDKLLEIIPNNLSVAAINATTTAVVAGENKDIQEFSAALDLKDIPNKLLFTSHAFHSSMMDPILGVFELEVQKIQLNKPNLPIVSTVTGTWLTDEEATNPIYWTNHLRKTVRFADAADTLLQLDDVLFLEVGPGQTLTTLTKQQGAGKIIPAFVSLPLPKNDQTEYHSMLNALGELWLKGIDPDWEAFYKHQKRQKINLPSYVFDRKHCWIEPLNIVKKSSVATLASVATIPLETVTEHNNNVDTNDSRKNSVLIKIAEIIKNVSGLVYENSSVSNTFLELGLDSLALTQLAGKLKKEFDLPISFRQLNESFSSPFLLSEYIINSTFGAQLFDSDTVEDMSSKDTDSSFSSKNSSPSSLNQNQITLEQIVQQIALLSQKLDVLQSNQANANNDTLLSADLNSKVMLPNELNIETQIEIKEKSSTEKDQKTTNDEPPVPEARLGRDEDGNPAWFIEDPDQKGEYIIIDR